MLTFPKEYFETQVREGFMVDTTMKTVWAAEIEVLNEVAVVCDRHGLTWYAAYGTLLGAARHGGFVPWDDDIDIWMLREDYSKLMEYLPQELPNGFVIRSPHAREGYPEYQVYIDNCDRISIEPEHLERFHGCPFMVGIDIFPLDTLPDDKKKLDMQKALFSTALMLQQMEYNKRTGIEETTAEEAQRALRSVEGLLHNLKQLYGIRISSDVLKGENREKGLEQLWKAAESLGKGGSHVAMYLDYLRFGKKYPKTWFERTDALDFEGFQIPVPCNYDEVLQAIYRDWHVINKKARMHDYPCYASQLREMRKYVSSLGGRTENAGLVNARDSQEPIFPADWERLLDGRKVVLFVDDIQLHAEFGEKALDKLEQSLRIFEEHREEILLWWRPQAQMKTLLGLLSQQLVDRYDRILKDYKDSGWGICDETNDEDRAAKYCDAYYGEMNYIAQSIQGQKPIMIEKLIN